MIPRYFRARCSFNVKGLGWNYVVYAPCSNSHSTAYHCFGIIGIALAIKLHCIIGQIRMGSQFCIQEEMATAVINIDTEYSCTISD